MDLNTDLRTQSAIKLREAGVFSVWLPAKSEANKRAVAQLHRRCCGCLKVFLVFWRSEGKQRCSAAASSAKLQTKQRGEFQQRLTEAGSDRRETKRKWEVWQEGKHSSQGTKCNHTASLESYSKHQTRVGWQGLGVIWTISWYDANFHISSSAILLFWYRVFLNHFAIIPVLLLIQIRICSKLSFDLQLHPWHKCIL